MMTAHGYHGEQYVKTGRFGTWLVLTLAVIAVGCAGSGKNLASNGIRNATESGHTEPVDPNNADMAWGTEDEFSDDEEFDLLEEGIAEQMVQVADPLESWNRAMVKVNDKLYFWVVKPVAKLHKLVVPKPVRIGIRNFFNNLGTPVRLVNCLLQRDNDGACVELSRFVVNTTVGVLGFGDPARDKLGLEPVKEDLGQTLATYGLGDGIYLVWPFFGPSTVRDSIGMVGDQLLNPVRYVEPIEASIGISVVGGNNEQSFKIGEYEAFKSSAVDFYTAMRRAYIQYRRKQIQE